MARDLALGHAPGGIEASCRQQINWNLTPINTKASCCRVAAAPGPRLGLTQRRVDEVLDEGDGRAKYFEVPGLQQVDAGDAAARAAVEDAEATRVRDADQVAVFIGVSDLVAGGAEAAVVGALILQGDLALKVAPCVRLIGI